MQLKAVDAVAKEQAGVLSLGQCAAVTLTNSSVQTLVGSRRWQRVYPGVFATYTGMLSDESRVWAGWLFAGPGAAASHQTAIWLAGSQRGRLGETVHMSVGRDRIVAPPLGLNVHRLERLEAWGGSPPRMSTDRALVEATHLADDVKQVVDLVCQVVGQRLTLPDRLVRELKKRPRHRWRALLTDMLAEVAEGARSPLELADLRNDRAHGLPAGNRQVSMRTGSQGRWLDVLVTVPGSALMLVKELDGRLGHEGVGAFRDMERDNAAAVRGGTPVRFGWTAIAQNGCQSAAFQSLIWQRHDLQVGRSCRSAACGLDERVGQLAIAHPRWDAA